MHEQINDSDSITEGQYFFPVIPCPKTEEEALDLILNDQKSDVANDASPMPVADLDLELQSTSFLDQERQVKAVLEFKELKMQRSMHFTHIESQRLELFSMSPSQVAEQAV
jgi:hypothetical protein